MRARIGAAMSATITATIAFGMVAPPASAVTPPNPPTSLDSFPAQHGVGLDWKGNFTGGTPSTYSVYSRPDSGSAWTFIGSAPVTADHQGTYIDGTITKGTTEQYSVTETTSGVESAKSDPVTVSRPTTDPILSDVNAITVDALSTSGLTSEHFGPDAGGTFTLTNGTLSATQGNESASVDLPLVEGPGTYTIGGSGIDLNLTTDSQTCGTETGSMTVLDAAYNANLDPLLFSASYSLSCDGKPTVYGDVRYNSSQLFRDLVYSPSAITGGTPVGIQGNIGLSITNYGNETASIGAATITGPNKDEWTFTGCANKSISAGGSCFGTVSFNPADRGERTATLTVNDNSARGSHVISLDGVGEVAPTAPPVSAGLAIHRVELTWDPPVDNGGAPITDYLVYRASPGQGQQLVDEVTPTNPDTGGSYTETNVATGTMFTYSVVAQNAAGDSPDAIAQATTPADELLLDASKAMTTDGDEPVDIADPDIRGRVAVVPGSNRIVFPQKYSDGNVDLVVASPFNTVGPARLTTIGATDPAVSMDSRLVAFVHVNGSGTPSIWTVPLSGGTPKQLVSGYSNPAWLSDGKTLIAEPETQEGTPETGQSLVTISPSGTATPIPGTTDGHEASVSPDGSEIAYSLDNAGTYSLAVIPTAGGTAQLAGNSGANPLTGIGWRTDGGEIFAAQDGKVKSATYSTGSGLGALATVSPPDVTNVQWPAYINSNAVSLLDAIPVTGKRPTVDIGSATGTTTTCRLDGGSATPCPSKWTSVIDLAAGAHSLVVTSTPTEGIASTVVWGFRVDRTSPTVKLFKLPKKTKKHHVAINYSGHDPNGIASFDVRYRSGKSHHSLGKYQYPSTWQATTRTIEHLHVKAGHLYCASVRSRDLVGNTSKWSKERCVVAKKK